MARRYGKKKHGKKSFTLPMAIVIPAAVVVYNHAKAITSGADPSDIVMNATGVDPRSGTFHGHYLMTTWGPLAAGLGIHWIASKFGVNKMLGRAKVPIFRV